MGREPPLIVGHAVTRIGLYIVLQKTLASNDTRLRMMTGTTMTLGTLAQRIDIDLIEELLSLAHCEQFAGLLALAAKALRKRERRLNWEELSGRLCYSLSAASRRRDNDTLCYHWPLAHAWSDKSPSSWDSDSAQSARSHSAPPQWSVSRCSHGSVCKEKE